MTQTDVLYIAGRTDPKYICINCLRSDYDSGDDSIGMPGYLYCEADTEGILDLERINYARTCPLFQLIDRYGVSESESSIDPELFIDGSNYKFNVSE